MFLRGLRAIILQVMKVLCNYEKNENADVHQSFLRNFRSDAKSAFSLFS